MVAVLTVFYWAINFIWLLLVVGGIMASLLPDTKVTTWSIILVVSVLATLITLSL